VLGIVGDWVLEIAAVYAVCILLDFYRAPGTFLGFNHLKKFKFF